MLGLCIKVHTCIHAYKITITHVVHCYQYNMQYCVSVYLYVTCSVHIVKHDLLEYIFAHIYFYKYHLHVHVHVHTCMHFLGFKKTLIETLQGVSLAMHPPNKSKCRFGAPNFCTANPKYYERLTVGNLCISYRLVII